jgi:demethylmenaquinone methyltransferase/2-methoxy-6-polyprenyl-1,4-benzoquinol methylase
MTTSIKEAITAKKPSSIREMFDAIAPTYDLLNHVLSFGFDIAWRKKAVSYISDNRYRTILDIAAGSGDVAFEILKKHPKTVVGADFALNMLNVLKQKKSALDSQAHLAFTCCDALYLPFRNESFDATIVAFGIRNFADRLVSLHEMLRVLKPNGISIILELTVPTSPIISRLYKIHSCVILPTLGKIISRHTSAYTYLPNSIKSFPTNEEFLSLMKMAGFTNAEAISLSFGAATIFKGKKLIYNRVKEATTSM